MAGEEKPYRSALALTLGTALGAGFLVGLLDALSTLRGTPHEGGGTHFVLVTMALYGLLAVLIGLGEGIILGAIRASHPGATVGGLVRRFRDDPELDRRVAAALLAGAAAAVLYAGAIAVLSLILVGSVARKSVGALLLGGVAAALAPIFFLLGYPFYRVGRLVTRIVPRLGPIPATAVLLVAGAAVFGAGGAFVVMRRLDWQALPLGGPIAFSGFILAQLALAALAYGPLDRLRARVPARGIIVMLLAIVTAGGSVVILGSRPTPPTVALLAASHGAKVLGAIGRRLADRDHDGHAAFLGGGDCEEGNAAVHPGAYDEPGNGIDENCLGGDAKGEADAPDQPVPDPGSKAAAFEWKGNVVFLAIDTLRADRLGAAGYMRRGGKSLTPRIDELARSGVYFRRAYAQAPRTPTSFPSIFTSRYPSQVAWDQKGANYPVVLPENVTLFEALGDADVKTIGFSSHFYFTEERGIRQGFAEYDNEGALDIAGSNKDIASPRIVPKVKKRFGELGKSGERFAMFVHLFEPHSTYVEHPEFPVAAQGGFEAFEEKYDWEVAYVDRWVGEVVDGLKEAGLADKTMIVLFSDHGEAFSEHRVGGQKMNWHGQTLYEEVIRVPLIVVAPGLAADEIDQPVMLIDVAPTVLAAMGAPVPKEFRGRSLVPLLVGESLAPRPAHAELLPYPAWKNGVKTLITADGASKIVYRVEENLFEVYDLAADAKEQENLVEKDAARAGELKQAIASWMESELAR